MHVRATHRIEIAAPIDRCIRLFTPRGEELWVEGWKPRYVHPPDGRTQAGMVFTTGDGDGRTIWMMVEWADHRVRYARVTPASRTGFVEVICTTLSSATTAVDVTYELAALTPEASLADYAPDRFPSMIEGWKAAIDAKLPTLLEARIE